jgi:prepilin-type N-terminal cleavage/methylation domain-containing protein
MQRTAPNRQLAIGNWQSAIRGFTLVEMVIVVAVVLLILGIVLPAASTLWKQRRISEAQNTIGGTLMTARAKAMENDFGDSGLLFYLDDAGVQRIAAINQDAVRAANPDTREAWANVFNILPERTYTMPVPMRVVPRYAVYDENTEPDKFNRFDPDELAHNDFTTLPTAGERDQAQRHRNFFTMIYSSDGQLRVRRDVLIRDADVDADQNPGGDATGLGVGGAGTPPAPVSKYYDQANVAQNIDPKGVEKIDSLVSDTGNRDVALNFPSVDGLLVYDESLFAAAGDAAAKRKYLLESAQPFYVHRLTGAVVRGPVAKAP